MQRLPDPLEWLAAGVPLTLLLDLLYESGPQSADIYGRERADDDWLHPAMHAA